MSYTEEIRPLIGKRPLLAPGVAVLVLDPAGRILLLKRTDDGTWTLPGGYMEVDETPTAAARREVGEEIGLSVGGLELLDVFGGPEVFHTFPNGDQVANVSIAYVTRDTAGTPRVDGKEVSQAQFFAPDALPESLFRPILPILSRFRAGNGG